MPSFGVGGNRDQRGRSAEDASIAFVGTPAVRKLLEGRTRDTTGIGFDWQDNAIASCPAFASTLMPSATLVSGAFSSVYLGLWGAGFQIDSNPYDGTLFKSGITQWRVMLSVDVAVGCDPAAFSDRHFDHLIARTEQ